MGGLGELVLKGMRNSAIILAIVTAGGCSTFNADYAPLRAANTHSDIKATIHYIFSPAKEVGKLYLAVIGMWKDAFGDDVKIKPYCTPINDNGVYDEMYCENDSERVRNTLRKMTGEELRVPAVIVEYEDGRSVRASSDADLCALLDRPADCLDDARTRMYSHTRFGTGKLSRNHGLDSHPLRY